MSNLTTNDFAKALTYLKHQPKNQPFELDLFFKNQDPITNVKATQTGLQLALHHMLNPAVVKPTLEHQLWYQAFYQGQLGSKYEMEYQFVNLIQQSLRDAIPDFVRLNRITTDAAKIQQQSDQYLYDIESDDLAKPATNAVVIKKLNKLYALAKFDELSQ